METSPKQTVKPQWVTIPCGMCHNHCGIQVNVKDGMVVGVRGWSKHPYSRGRICIKALQIPEQAHHSSRLKYPMKKENGQWQRISWDEALDTISSKLKEGKEEYGAPSFGALCGDPVELASELGSGMIWRFCDVYGTPSRFHAGDMCYIPLALAQVVTLGSSYEPDIANSNCIIVWADNPRETFHVVYSDILNAKKRGAKLILIDPRQVSLSEQADLHVRPRIGTDAVILLAMINIIISEDLYDKNFVENWTVGFDKLAEHVKRYTPEEAERISGVAAEDIRKIARMYATTKPSCIQYGFKLPQCRGGFQNSRALAILSAITGNIQVTGGDLKRFTLRRKPVKLRELMSGLKHPAVDKYPIYSALPFFGDGCMTNWGDLVLNEPQQLRSMIVSGANPAVTWPNTAKVKKALDKLDFLVVMDVFMTATAQQADIVLPACTFLEKTALIQWRGCSLRRPVIEPQWESWPDFKFWVELAKRMGYEQYFPWRSEAEAFDYFYQPSGLSINNILDTYPDGYIHLQTMPGEQQYIIEGFQTPSRKVELYSSILEKLGHDPLPVYLEPEDSPLSNPDLFKQFPLILTTGTRDLEWYHSEHRHLEGLRRRNPEATAQIHHDTASKYGIADGDTILVETKIGSLKIKARVSADIVPGMVSIPHGWDNAPENMLTDDTPADPVSGFATFTSLLCRVRKYQVDKS